MEQPSVGSLSQANISLLSEEYVRRLREVFVSYVSGVRSSDPVQAVIQRPQADGGAGFSRQQAELFLKTMLDFMATTHVLSEQDYAAWLARQQEMADTVQAIPATRIMGETDGAMLAVVPTSTVTPQAKDVVDQATQSVMQELADIPLDEYLRKRLEKTISIRLRDVRSDIQTKAILQRDEKVGGVSYKYGRSGSCPSNATMGTGKSLKRKSRRFRRH